MVSSLSTSDTGSGPGRLTDHAVIVTGAAQGIGAEYAVRLAGEGCRLILADNQGDKVVALADRLTAAGATAAVGLRVDVTDNDSVRRMVATAVERFGRLDGIINNAAIYFGLKPVESIELSRERWERTLNVNVWGTHLCSSIAAEAMKPRGRGRIINISSTTAYFGAPRMADYVASKGAIIALSRSMAREYGSSGITVNVIAPGGTWTQASEELLVRDRKGGSDPSTVRAKSIAEQAIARQQVPADVTGTACFLLSDDAEMITGQVLIVDGGHVFG